MRTLTVLATFCLLLLGCGGQSLPETYMDACSDTAECADGLECLVVSEEADESDAHMACSQACESDADCPEHVTRHCGNLSFCTDHGVCSMSRCL